jgi:hypothetical protein
MAASGPRLIKEYSIWSAANGFRPHFGQADVADVPGLHHIGDGADGLLDGDRGVQAGGPVDVDAIHTEAGEAVREEVLYGGGTRVKSEPDAIGTTERAELDRDQGLAATALERAAHQDLIVSHAVEIAGVEQRDAGVQGGVDGSDALVVVGGTVHSGHSHAAEGQRKNGWAGGAELAGIGCGICGHGKPS